MFRAFLSLFFFLGAFFGYAQSIKDTVSVRPGYSYEVYYGFSQGEIAAISNQDWELAFDLEAFGFGVRINDALGLELFVAPVPVSDWGTPLDTTGMNAWKKVRNSDTSWSLGAFNTLADTANPYDLGWGMYNATTHVVSGTKIFVLKYADGSAKKIMIESLNAGKWIFKYANLDNSSEIRDTIVKSDYTGKNFVYYSLKNQSVYDREPLSDQWDILFTQYVTEVAPGMFYKVTGVLQNKGVFAYKDTSAPTFTAAYNPSRTFRKEINTIGYDWKSFDMNTYAYVLDDSATYFVKTKNGAVWKLGFLEFAGSSTGNIVLQKELEIPADLQLAEQIPLEVYPTRVSDKVYIKTSERTEIEVTLFSLLGTKLMNKKLTLTGETAVLNVPELPEGIYFLSFRFSDGSRTFRKIIVQ